MLDVSKMVDALLDAVDAPLRRLADRIAALEARPTLKYCGVHDPARQYGEGEFVTHQGSLWHCNRLTRSAPGAGEDWTLAVKRGRNGKDQAK